MVPFSSRIDGIYPYLDETLVAMELAYRDGDIRRVKEALVSDILKHASIETRSRAANVVVQRFLPFDSQTFQIVRTPWLEFVNQPFSRDSKIKALWYIYARGNPLFHLVVEELHKERQETFSRAELGIVASKVLGREVKGTALDVLAVFLRDAGLIRFEKSKGKAINRLIPNTLPFSAFSFVLYHHFLDQGTIVPKITEVKDFFCNWYNQPEEETERLVRNAPQGLWVIERMAHLDQLALVCNSMDEVLKRLTEATKENGRG